MENIDPLTVLKYSYDNHAIQDYDDPLLPPFQFSTYDNNHNYNYNYNNNLYK